MTTSDARALDHDVIIIGAGIAGVHQLYRLRDRDLSVVVLEAGSGVGGTWYWNRYPMARFDSESYSYGYFFDKDLLEDWEWSEHFAGQPETERYVNHVVDRFGLREHIRFHTRVVGATFDDAANVWTVRADDGSSFTARWVIACTGLLSMPFTPQIPGRELFRGEQYHTGTWPKDEVDLRGKRVAMIGTGASAIQLLPAIAPDTNHLTVYQRTPNWAAPLNNGPISAQEQQELKASHDKLHELLSTTFAGFPHPDGTRMTFEETKEQRLALYEELYTKRGFAKLLSNYADLLVDAEANAEFSNFLADKIRARVHDPATAEKLIPKDHGYGMKRPPMESGYFEAYNLPQVSLVDLNETPIERITETGIVTSAGAEELDVIIWATGFDAVTGAMTRMGITSPSGLELRDQWADGPRTYLGLQAPGFPNLFIVGGPHFPFSNVPRGIDVQVDFITALLDKLVAEGCVRVEPSAEAEQAWVQHVAECAEPFLIAESAWYTGANIPGKANRDLLYFGGLVNYRNKLAEVVADGYQGFVMQRQPAAAAAG